MSETTLEQLLQEVRQTRATMERVERELCRHVAQGGDRSTIKQAAHEFGRSEDTVRRWCVYEGLGTKIGGVWYVDRSRVAQAKRILPRQNA